MKTRVVGASRGDALTRYLFDALDRRYAMVARIDAELRPWQRYAIALASYHPSRPHWGERFYKNLQAFKLRSSNGRHQLARVRQPFDVVLQVHALFRTQGAPYMIYVDNTHHQSVQGWPGWSPLSERKLAQWYALERATYDQASHLFTMGAAAARSLVTFYGIPEERVSIVGGGANFDILPTLSTQPRKPVILFVGNDYRRKGGDTLIAAFRRVRQQLPAARLLLVGTPVAVDEPGIQVLGRIKDRQHIAQLYAQASVFCLPSHFEPFSLALIEAMAYGLPCVGTTVGGTPEVVVDGQTGLLVAPGDDTALAAALLRLLENPGYAAQLGHAGRQRVERHLNWDKVVDRMAIVLDPLSQPLATRYEARGESFTQSWSKLDGAVK